MNDYTIKAIRAITSIEDWQYKRCRIAAWNVSGLAKYTIKSQVWI